MVFGAIIAYASERISLELTSIAIISILLLFFHFFPVVDESGTVVLSMERLLAGFANPALIAVLSLLVLGQAIVQTGALNEVANFILRIGRNNAFISITMTLIVVMVISALLNNTPVVVIFIPIMAALAKGVDWSVSKLMIPLSFASILGGMTTLIGSSTNLLVSSMLVDLGVPPLGFFDFTIPGSILAAIGLVYIVFIAPRLLPDRASLAKAVVGEEDVRKFVAQVEVDYDSDLIGQKVDASKLEGYPDLTIRMIQRGEHAFLPPFDEEMAIKPHDLLVVSGTRKDIANLFSRTSEDLLKETVQDEEGEDEGAQEDVSVAEIVIAPASRMIGRTLEAIGFHREFNCVVLGIQRQSRVIRSRVTEIRLAAGDVLLVLGKQEDILALQNSKDLLLMEWSTEEIHSGQKAKLAGGIFFSAVALAALGLVPITVAAFAGVGGILLTRCINLRQAARALDLKILLMIAASLALGASLQETGGASYLAESLVSVMHGASPALVMAALFILMATLTNILSNNASAVLFTPIAVNVAEQLAVDPRMFIFAVIFACNCSFATPIGYQTNLLVMGPGHNKFVDFMKVGIPLVLVICVAYALLGPWYFGYEQ